MSKDPNRPQEKNEVFIAGTLYDITGFRHPGGSVVKFMAGGGDATEAYQQFHVKSKKADKMLKALPNRPAPKPDPKDKVAVATAERNAKFSADFGKLHAELLKDGWFDANYLHIAYRIAEVVAFYAVGIYLILNTNWFLTGVISCALAQGRCGWLMHEGGHISMTGIWKLDIKLQELIYGVGCGMSGGWWRVQHNKHHAVPQKLQHDVDLDTLPLVAFNEKVTNWSKANGFLKFWIPMQAYFFGPVTTSFVAAFWQFFLHPRYIVRTKKYFEAFSIAIRYAIIAWMFNYSGCSLTQGLQTYFLYNGLAGAYIFLNFAVSHTHLPVVDKGAHVHWLEYGSVHTMNCTPHWFTNWWMSYLNFQIEHHLFPCMPQYRFAKLWPRIKELFERNGLVYDVRDYFIAMKDTHVNLARVGAEVQKA